jgi:hypothetical protein
MSFATSWPNVSTVPKSLGACSRVPGMSDRLEDIVDVALRVAEALEKVGASYFVGGSLASSIDGEPRATNDIDFVIHMAAGKVRELIALLGSDFEIDGDMLRDAILNGRSANIFYLPLVLKIDFFGHPHGPYDESEFSRRRPVVVRAGRTLMVKAPEDTILRKMLWFRAGGEVSDRQWRDVLGVLRAQRDNLDRDYLRDWAVRLTLVDLLARATAQVEEEPG